MLEHTEYSFGKNKGYYRCYCTVLQVLTPNGNYWRPAAYGKTKKEAREKLEAKILEKEKTLNTPESTDELKSAIKIFNERTAITKRNSPATIEYLNRVLKNQIEPYGIAKMKVKDVEHEDILDYIKDLAADGVSEAMQKKAYNVLTAFFSDYYKQNPFHNPTFGLKFSSGIRKVEVAQIMNDEEINRYLAVCQESREEFLSDGRKNKKYEKNADVLIILLLTYMRSGEALALKYSDWLVEDESIRIARTISRDRDGKMIVGSKTKTDASSRILKINRIVTEVLEERRKNVTDTEDYSSRLIWHSESDINKPLSKNVLKNVHNRILKRAGIQKHIRIHDLRHTGISYYLRHGSPLAEVSKRAGHSCQSITADIYSHVLAESLAEQSKREERMIEQLLDSENRCG